MKISSSERILLLDLIQDLMGEESTDYYNEDAEGNEIETPYECGFVMSDYCLLYTSPSPRDLSTSRMPSSA